MTDSKEDTSLYVFKTTYVWTNSVMDSYPVTHFSNCICTETQAKDVQFILQFSGNIKYNVAIVCDVTYAKFKEKERDHLLSLPKSCQTLLGVEPSMFDHVIDEDHCAANWFDPPKCIRDSNLLKFKVGKYLIMKSFDTEDDSFCFDEQEKDYLEHTFVNEDEFKELYRGMFSLYR